MIDPPVWPGRDRLWAHLCSDSDLGELHDFAARLGLPERAFERDHYDVPKERYRLALSLGAEAVDARTLMRRLTAAGLRRPKHVLRSNASLPLRVRRLWAGLSGVAVPFPPRGSVAVAVSPRSRMCPPEWSGIVRIGDAALATAATDREAEMLRQRLSSLLVPDLTNPLRLREVLPVADLLGPAWLAYVDHDHFRAVQPDGAIHRRPANHPDLRALLGGVTDADREESGIAEITSEAFVVYQGGRIIAASGWRHWPDEVAQLGVLTAPQARGRGWGRAVASAATAHALDASLLPQWRAQPEPSRRIAHALGFREMGAQISFKLGPCRA